MDIEEKSKSSQRYRQRVSKLFRVLTYNDIPYTCKGQINQSQVKAESVVVVVV